MGWKIILPIGFAIGVAVALPVSFALLQQGTGGSTIRDNSIECETEECLSFYIWGIVRAISAESLTLVQSNQTGSESSSSITIAPFSGGSLLWCTADDGTKCSRTTYDKVPTGTLACAHARLNPDGTFNIDRIFFNTVCTTQVSVNPDTES